MSETKNGNFYEGMATVTRTLDNIEMKHGFSEAKATARATIAEYIRTAEKSAFDYGVFCGAAEWLATAEGIKNAQEVY